MPAQPHGAFSPAGTAASSGSGTAWTNPDNAKVVDGNYATCERTGTGDSEELLLSNFGFTVPDGAAITGVYAKMNRGVDGAGAVAEKVFQLDLAGSGIGRPQNLSAWPKTEAVAYKGGSLNTWGATLTPAIVRTTTFGVNIQVTITCVASTTANLDYVTLSIFYVHPEDVSQGLFGRLRTQRRTRRIPAT